MEHLSHQIIWHISSKNEIIKILFLNAYAPDGKQNRW